MEFIVFGYLNIQENPVIFEVNVPLSKFSKFNKLLTISLFFSIFTGLFDEIDDPDKFLSELLQSLPGGN